MDAEVTVVLEGLVELAAAVKLTGCLLAVVIGLHGLVTLFR